MPIARSSSTLRLIHGSFSPKKVARQYPVLAGFHRATDGALWGVLVAVLMMSALSLHWRHLWTVAYTQLETTRELTHKLKSSTAMIEQHLLKRSKLPLSMVRTNAAKLYYLDNPDIITGIKRSDSVRNSLLKRFASYPVNYGY
ncbi:hypothetical protein [Prochlorococcus sp. MIT 1307]|uniref:hypothetical protein n=1 Tax=Prochlorococcus sp. MIT 1307 TaxID=3096219 RepID=UPI002A75F58E|nr:hypothetical protein [Prochlorococcus sp. MIT 1307]